MPVENDCAATVNQVFVNTRYDSSYRGNIMLKLRYLRYSREPFDIGQPV